MITLNTIAIKGNSKDNDILSLEQVNVFLLVNNHKFTVSISGVTL